uniref:Uncharacterized protein n=1 Tax=Glossina palpalis gambiensis TaxID=67801 RepID=A0A1B0B4A4_9MUSC
MLISDESEPMTIAGCLLSRKEIEYRQEQRSPIPMQTTNSPQSSLSSTTTAAAVTTTTTTTITGLLNEQIGSGRVHHFHNHHNHHQNHNQQQQQQHQQQQQQHQASESRFAANLNLSLLAGKSATLLSVVNETSNQTVLRTTTITNTTAEEDSQHMKNFQLNKNEKDTVTNIHFDTAKSTVAIDAAAAAAAAAASAVDKLQDNCNGDVCEAATAVIINRHHTQTTDKVNKCNIESNNSQINRNDNNNLSAKSVINATTTTTTTATTSAATTISENYQEKLENCEEFEKTLNNELQQQHQQQPVNYRGVNNTVIITNYNHNAQQQHHHNHHHHQHHQHHQQQQHSDNSFSVQTVEYDSQTSNILSSTSDPNLNLAVIGIPTPQSANQSAQQSVTSSEQLQEHAHHYSHQPSVADQWLNVYNNCAYDLSLNHTQSVNDLTSQLLTSTLTQLQQHSHHHHHHHHTHPQNLAYYPAHLINPGAAITAATTLANASSYTLHDDTMRSNTTLYSTSYAPTGHEHLHQHTQLVGTTPNTPHTPTNIDEVIQDTLKGECLDDHHTAVSYLTNLNSVVDAQTLKDTYHSANLGHELSTLTVVAPAHLQSSSNHLQTIHHLHQNNSVSSGGNSPSPSSALSQTGDVATLQSFTQLTNANASSHRDIYGLLTTDQNSMSYFTSPPSPVLSQG